MIALTFYRPVGIFGRLIACWTKGSYEHVAITLPVLGTWMLFQATPSLGVHCMPVDRSRKADDVVPVELDADRVGAWLLAQCGIRYSWKDVFAFVPPSYDKGKDYPGVICTELVVEMFKDYHKATGICPFPGMLLLPNAKASPQEIYNAVAG